MTIKKIVSVIAAVAAIAFVTAPFTAMANNQKVPCYGVNACKGKSECKPVMKTAKSCKKSGGKTEEQKS
jgi:hypothetical protein